MAAYVIVQALEITDPEGMNHYVQQVGPLIQQHGGRVVAGGQVTTLEGGPQPVSMFVIAFPGEEDAQRWYDAEEYREPKALRQRSSRMNLFLVSGT